VAAIVNNQTLAIFAKDPSLHITGNLEYQACTSKVCFPRVKVPLSWTVQLTELDASACSISEGQLVAHFSSVAGWIVTTVMLSAWPWACAA
jgi:hypothetical protein